MRSSPSGDAPGPGETVNASPTSVPRHATLRYTGLRLALFLVAAILLWLVRVRGALLVVLALVISGLASYVLLARWRDAVATELAAFSERRKARAAARVAREDAYADALELQEQRAAARARAEGPR